MKIAPLYRAMSARPEFNPVLVHTGQHFDRDMSDDFLEVLELPKPDVHLGVGGGTQATQMAEVMLRLETVMIELRPDITVVVGDVTSTLGAALTAATLDIPVAHVEAGLRSRDWRMPEERNRVLTDRLSALLFAPSVDAEQNLLAEGIPADRIFVVGNVMMDSLDWVLPRVSRADVQASFAVDGRAYGLVTLHRPSNVDTAPVLGGILSALARVAADVPLLFPIHPRTRQRIESFGLDVEADGLRALPPMRYDVFTALLAGAAIVLTDSGGIQEEATALGVPCLTLRDTTERPITLTYGDNELVGADPERIVAAARRRLDAPPGTVTRPPLWDGKTAGRILDVLGR
jgi:UDP-N-acetylglucosamine 2-epimerase (non-hydrolysing)